MYGVCVCEYEQVVHVSVCGCRCYVATGISHTELLGRWIFAVVVVVGSI